jgi:hypothetical protein
VNLSSNLFDIFFILCFLGTPQIQITNPDEDPLPNEDNSVSEKDSNDGQSHNDLVTINVTNSEHDQQLKLSNG